jgi:16S rRNA (uracil1498-N3)-methyltransferase
MVQSDRRAPLCPLVTGEQQLPRELGTYLVRVLRLRAGDHFVLFDPEAGTEADAELLRDIPAIARVSEPRLAPRAAVREVALLQGFARGDKPEHVLRAAVALGASSVTFVRTERSIAGAELRAPRLRAVMVDAARQCGRADLPALGGLVELEAAVAAARGRKLQLAPNADVTLVGLLRGLPADAAITLAIGPEGGFSPSEAEQLAAAGFEPVRLSAYVLRTELAAVAALSVVAAHE